MVKNRFLNLDYKNIMNGNKHFFYDGNTCKNSEQTPKLQAIQLIIYFKFVSIAVIELCRPHGREQSPQVPLGCCVHVESVQWLNDVDFVKVDLNACTA